MEHTTSLPVAERPVLTTAEVAELLGTSPSTVVDMVNAGTLPSVRLGSQGKRSPIRIPTRRFYEWLEAAS